jgi:hypothetical protein
MSGETATSVTGDEDSGGVAGVGRLKEDAEDGGEDRASDASFVEVDVDEMDDAAEDVVVDCLGKGVPFLSFFEWFWLLKLCRNGAIVKMQSRQTRAIPMQMPLSAHVD